MTRSGEFQMFMVHYVAHVLFHPKSLCGFSLELSHRKFIRAATTYLQHSLVESDLVIVSLPLIPEGHLSVSGKRMCTKLFNRLED